MDNSEEQFPELVSQLIVRAQKSLRESNSFSPLGLSLNNENKIEVTICVDIDNFGEQLNLIQSELKKKAASSNIKACSISYADYENGLIVSFLENKDNYCLKVEIPVLLDKIPELDIANLKNLEGSIYVFEVPNGS